MERRRSTILSADVVGYCQLMANDELLALRLLVDARLGLGSLVDAYGGRVLDVTGDSLLAEFSREDRALLCALEMQRWLALRRSGASDLSCLRVRIGVHSGLVIVAGGSVFGTAVNIASRLQAAARPDGVLASVEVFERVTSGRLAHESAGALLLKNIPTPVSALHVSPR